MFLFSSSSHFIWLGKKKVLFFFFSHKKKNEILLYQPILKISYLHNHLDYFNTIHTTHWTFCISLCAQDFIVGLLVH